MKTTTKKDILQYLNTNNDLNNYKDEDIDALQLNKVAISYGTYGMNAGLFYSRVDNEYYVVPNRSTTLFKLF